MHTIRFGKVDGSSGADEICRQVAEMGMPGAGQKQWRAFLIVTSGPGGEPVNARDRIGSGPWYDRQGRLVANSVADLFTGVRHQVPGCAAGVDRTLGGSGGNCIGCSGGHGGFYCFALP